MATLDREHALGEPSSHRFRNHRKTKTVLRCPSLHQKSRMHVAAGPATGMEQTLQSIAQLDTADTESLAPKNERFSPVDETDSSRADGAFSKASSKLLAQPAPAVRFKQFVEEIALPEVLATQPDNAYGTRDQKGGQEGLERTAKVTAAQWKALTSTLKACPLQEQRARIFAYEPMSLPASRTASRDDSLGEQSSPERLREPSVQSARIAVQQHSIQHGSRASEMSTPPLTPAGTFSVTTEPSQTDRRPDQDMSGRRADIVTSQEFSHGPVSPGSSRLQTLGALSAEQISLRPHSSGENEALVHGNHRKGLFAISPADSLGSSVPASRESSPCRAGAASESFSRRIPPKGDSNDPYAADRRTAQKGIESRFVFTRKSKTTSPTSSSIKLPKSCRESRRHSSIFAHRKEDHDEGTGPLRSGSMADLRKFLKKGLKAKRSLSPASSTKSGSRTSSHRASMQIPFGDDHGLTSKYGKLGKVLGSGAGGSVRLMKRSEDGTVFAVKEFRSCHSYETEKEYVKKLTAEYCMGSSLHHGNIIETLDIIQEKGKWYQVMEYAPYDLFAIVMTGKMTKEEISCCFLQILSGVTYLHSMGLAHRDLKLDNVVVSEHGIMKIIDFGSAHVFKYPFENGIVLASGIVGSDPYLAPEVYEERKYDPQAVDIWSLAIIFCCMTLRRFPWKVPRMTDSSYKLFAAEPTPGHDPKRLTSYSLLPPPESVAVSDTTHERGYRKGANDNEVGCEKSEHSAKSGSAKDHDKEKQKGKHGRETTATQDEKDESAKKEVIRGPWRILRLLSRESRRVIGRMLELDPKTRAKMDEVIEDAWVSNTVVCRQIKPGFVVRAELHTHILEPPASATAK